MFIQPCLDHFWWEKCKYGYFNVVILLMSASLFGHVEDWDWSLSDIIWGPLNVEPPSGYVATRISIVTWYHLNYAIISLLHTIFLWPQSQDNCLRPGPKNWWYFLVRATRGPIALRAHRRLQCADVPRRSRTSIRDCIFNTNTLYQLYIECVLEGRPQNG